MPALLLFVSSSALHPAAARAITSTSPNTPNRISPLFIAGVGENASGDNTPRVGPKGSVEVDTLRWRLNKAKTAKTIGDQQYGLGAKANGIYVVADLSVKNNKNESVTLTSEVVSLVAGEKVYTPDNSAEGALVGDAGRPSC